MPSIEWFHDRASFSAAADRIRKSIAEQDIPIAQQTSISGHCPVCRRPTTFQVNTGAMFAGRPNLREGLRCVHCGLTARQRLILLAMEQEMGSLPKPLRGALLEQSTRLYRTAHARWPWLTGSEYLGDDHIGGRSYWWSTHWWRWRRTRNESITSLSYGSGSLSLMVHSDVLEHVYDTQQALSECARVLRKGGEALFSVPFFAHQAHSSLRGRLLDNGQIEHLQPPEYHGDGISRGGAYTFHHFGWDFFDLLGRSGFSAVEIGLCHAPDEGLTSADPAGDEQTCMLPIVFRAVK